MAVDPEGDGDRGMAEALLHDSRMDVLLVREGCPRMMEPVQRESGQSVVSPRRRQRCSRRPTDIVTLCREFAAVVEPVFAPHVECALEQAHTSTVQQSCTGSPFVIGHCV